MRYLVSILGFVIISANAFAASGRMSAAAQMTDTSRISLTKTPMAVVSVKPGPSAQPGAVVDMNTATAGATSGDKTDTPDNSNKPDNSDTPNTKPEKDMREKEKAACINNNIGVGNTFVWASRYSNTGNYATMVEDVENPENNVCFLKVDLKSDDAKVSVADVPSKYFVMGQNITCGSWVDEKDLEKRILDAKKSARTWATVGGVVGGAGVGVGAMELFGNKLIGGAVEGQKAKNLSDTELLYSQMVVLKKNNDSRYTEIMRYLEDLDKYCEDSVWDTDGVDKPEECSKLQYKQLLQLKNKSV